ncbi:MAG: hypothetical protein SPL30_00155 [Succinivibrio sp.]|jgi:hypothetical protein|nr:hypothetical protein [Succinivibrio sp.]
MSGSLKGLHPAKGQALFFVFLYCMSERGMQALKNGLYAKSEKIFS